MAHHIFQFFLNDPDEHDIQDLTIGNMFYELAKKIDDLPENPEKSMALRKLLEAKDCVQRIKKFNKNLV